MRNGLRLDVWLMGLVVTVCLAGVTGAAYRFNFAGIQDLLPRSTAASKIPNVSSRELAANTASAVMLRENPVPPRIPQSARTATPPVVTRSTVRRPAITSVAGETGRSLTKPREAIASVPAAASLEPQRKVLKPLGYVQKANGSVEAIITQPDNTVALIHVGDAYDVNGEKFTVAKISSRAVEIVAAAAPKVPPSAVESVSNSAPTSTLSAEVLTASSGRRMHTPAANPQPAEGKSLQILRSSKIISRQSEIRISAARKVVESETAAVRSSGRQVALANSVSPEPKAIGYAEKSDGTRVALVADGESVRLVTENKSLAAQAVPSKTLVASETKVSASAAYRASSSKPDPDRNYAGALPALAARSAKAERPARINSAVAISSVPPTLATRTLSFRDNTIVLAHAAIVPAQKAVVTPARAAATPGRAVIPPKRTEASPTSIGFVERANGKIEAIVDGDEGQGVHLVPVRDSNPPNMVAAAKSTKPVEHPGRYSGQLPQTQVRGPDDGPGNNIIIAAVTTDATSGSTSTRGRAARTAEAAHSATEKEVAGRGPPPPVSEPRDPPPSAEIAWEEVQRVEGKGEALPEREHRAVAAPPRTGDPPALAARGSPPTPPTEAASVRGLASSVLFESLSLPSEQRLDLLDAGSPAFAPDRSGTFGFWNGKLPAGGRLSEVSFPRGKPPPELDLSRGREVGLADGAPATPDTPPDEPGSPDSLAPRPRVAGTAQDDAEGAEDNAGVPSINYLGYVEWQGGLTLAVVDDSDEGIRLVHEGDIVGDRFRVVKVQSGSVDIVELPASLALPVAAQLPASVGTHSVTNGRGNLAPRGDQKVSGMQSSADKFSAPQSIAGPVNSHVVGATVPAGSAPALVAR